MKKLQLSVTKVEKNNSIEDNFYKINCPDGSFINNVFYNITSLPVSRCCDLKRKEIQGHKN